MRSSLLRATLAAMMASTPATAFAKPRSSHNVDLEVGTSADDERKARVQAKRDRKAAKRAAQQGATP